MQTAQEIRAAALITGRILKRKNAITATLCGAVPGLIASFFIYTSSSGWILGIVLGLLWSNAFEYFYHRYLLHLPSSSFGKAHLMHHLTTGTPQEPEHVTFGSSPLWVAALFAINGAFALALELRFHLGLAPGILAGFSLYMVLVEEIHWRVHLGSSLPGLSWVREYHMAHHDVPEGRYNVFFPIFDFLFGNIRPPLERTEGAAMARAVEAAAAVESPFTIAVTQIAVWLWLVGMFVGARYFWTTKGNSAGAHPGWNC